jgi:multicomponent Na+:H+ antiporter subunit C
MEILLPLLAAALIGSGVFLSLSRALIRLIIGLSFLAYGANLSILLAGSGVEQSAPPLLSLTGPHNDALPQALILTAIVIGFGTTAVLLVLAVQAYQATGTDHVQELVERADPLEPPVVYADPEHPSVSPEIGPEGEP